MVDVIFLLFLNALFFLGIVAGAALLFLPFVKLFSRREKEEKVEKVEYAEDCA
ncbi:MAG: hypothetical protein P8130_12140 [Deltaproteobacteria bacterium]|jgi:hypothetical protein